MIKLYKTGDNMGIVTDAKTEEDFVSQFCSAMGQMIDKKMHEGDWEFQFSYWLPQFASICMAYRGYKTDVRSSTTFETGYFSPSNQTPEAICDDKGNLVSFERTGTVPPKVPQAELVPQD